MGVSVSMQSLCFKEDSAEPFLTSRAPSSTVDQGCSEPGLRSDPGGTVIRAVGASTHHICFEL